MSSRRFCFLSCGILKNEIIKLVPDKFKADVIFLSPKLHLDLDKLKRMLIKNISDLRTIYEDKVLVIYGDKCHPEIEEIIKKYKVRKLKGINCIDFLLGGKLKDIDPENQYIYLSPGWLENLEIFKEALSSQKNLKEIFKKYKGICLLDTIDNISNYKKEVKDFSEFSGLNVIQIKKIGLKGLEDLIRSCIS